MPASIRTLSQLPAITSEQLYNNSKLEVSIPVELSLGHDNEVVYKYASKSISAGALSEKISNDIRQGLIDENGLTKETRVDDLCTMVSAIAYKDFTFDGVKNFVKDPLIDNSPLSGFPLSNDSLNKYSVNYETLKKFSNINSAPLIGPNFGFVTRLSGIQGSSSSELSRLLTIFKPKKISGNDWTFSKEPYFVFNTNAKNIVPNEYVFKIEYGERESKPWKAPASGIFTCYGWLDEINNPAQSNESRWVALMGKESLLGENGWAILQVQPFIKNNYLSYVGFTFPVRKGMELKIVTGFAVGKNSDKYFGSNSSITNHIGNAFLGGVYTGLSAWNENGENYSTGDLSNEYVTSSDISNIWAHEEECDLSVRDLIDKLSTDLSAAISALSNDSGTTVNNYNASCYIDTTKLSAGIDAGGQCARQLNFGSNAQYNGSTLTGEPSYSYYYVGTEKTQKGILYKGHFYKLISDTTAHTIDGKKYIKINKQTYQLLDDPSGGENVFYTDDYFWYYTVCRDSFANIIAYPDFAGSPVTGIQCYLRYLDKDANPCFKMLGSATEYGGTGDTAVNVNLPLKRGSTIAFGAYVRKITDKTEKTQNFSGKTYSTASYKKTVKITATNNADTEHGAGKWPNSIKIPIVPNVKDSFLMGVTSSTVESIYVNINQTAGKCSIYIRLVNDAGTVIGAEKHMNANKNKTADLVWTGLNFGTSENINVQISYGEPAQNTTTQVTIKKLVVTAKYRESAVSKNILGTPMPMFTNAKVQDIIDGWKASGNHSGQLIQPHNHPAWLTKDASRFMATVSLMRLHP